MTRSTLSFPAPLGCADVDARLADYLDDEPPTTLAAAERTAVDRHVAACARCRALVGDLRAVSQAAATLPALEPPRDLWPAIAARLEPRATSRVADAHPAETDASATRVLPFDVHHLRHAPRPAHERRGTEHVTGHVTGHVTWPRRQLAAAAIALVCASAGGTYLLTRAATTPDAAPGTGTAQVATTRVPDGETSDMVPAPPADPTAEPDAAHPSDPEATLAPAARAAGAAGARTASRFVARRAVAGDAGDPAIDATLPAALAYDREITALRAVVRERRDELDSATVAVLARNLRIIDAAVAESRAALARDPHSQFLGDQLTRALGQKVELLRTVALMPRT